MILDAYPPLACTVSFSKNANRTIQRGCRKTTTRYHSESIFGYTLLYLQKIMKETLKHILLAKQFGESWPFGGNFQDYTTSISLSPTASHTPQVPRVERRMGLSERVTIFVNVNGYMEGKPFSGTSMLASPCFLGRKPQQFDGLQYGIYIYI